MGAAESTTRTNGTNEEEEEERQRASSGSSTAAGAAMALAAVGVAAWGISRMVSENTEKEKDDEMKMNGTLMETQSYGLPSPIPYSREEYGVGAGASNPRTGWCPPPLGCYKMNTDASCRQIQGPTGSGKIGPSGYAGVLRDHRGKWVQAFHGFIGLTDSLTAELSGIYYGLRLLDELGLKEATLESDCRAAIQWIEPENKTNRRRPIINKCWEMITASRHLILKNKITVSYCSRDCNKLADKLADMAIENQDKYKEITVIPAGQIKSIVDQESRST